MNIRLAILVLLLLGACSDANDGPRRIIAMNDIEKIIWDMVQVD